jgi:hypothetical protein
MVTVRDIFTKGGGGGVYECTTAYRARRCLQNVLFDRLTDGEIYSFYEHCDQRVPHAISGSRRFDEMALETSCETM